jgi:predicted GIY-YIG superfamily endonuclease
LRPDHDDGIVVEWRTTSIYFIAQTTAFYVGETSDLATRERQHHEGRGGSYTAKRRPVQIVYAEQYSSREEALRREQQIMRWNSQKKELLVRGDVAALSSVSQKARVRTGFTWRDWLAGRTE